MHAHSQYCAHHKLQRIHAHKRKHAVQTRATRTRSFTTRPLTHGASLRVVPQAVISIHGICTHTHSPLIRRKVNEPNVTYTRTCGHETNLPNTQAHGLTTLIHDCIIRLLSMEKEHRKRADSPPDTLDRIFRLRSVEKEHRKESYTYGVYILKIDQGCTPKSPPQYCKLHSWKQ